MQSEPITLKNYIHRAIVARLDWLGHADPTFNKGQGFTLGSSLGQTWGQHIALSPDLICIGGQQQDDQSPRNNFYALQLNAWNGSEHRPYGNSGLCVQPLPDPSMSVYDVAALCLQVDGAVTLAGSVRPAGGGPQPPVLMRLDDRGALDHRFGDNGVVLGAQHAPRLYGLALIPNGEAIAGVPLQTNSNSLQLLRAGKHLQIVTVPMPTKAQLVPKKLVTYGGNLYIAGHSLEDGSIGYFLAKLDATGQLDSSFGQQGLVLDEFNVAVAISALHVGPEGIYLAGNATKMPQTVALARHTLQGEADTDFSGNGKRTQTYQSLQSVHVEAVAAYPEGIVYLAGQANDKMFLAAFAANGDVLTHFGEHTLPSEPGTLLYDVFALADAQTKPTRYTANALAISDKGQLVLCGSSLEEIP